MLSLPSTSLEPWGNKPIDMDYQSGWDQLVSFVLGAGFGIIKPAARMIEDAKNICFEENTQVVLANLNGSKDISSACVNDKLASVDLETNSIVPTNVVAIFKREVDSLLGIRFSSGERLLVTNKYQFCVQDGWKEASQLKLGDIVRSKQWLNDVLSSTEVCGIELLQKLDGKKFVVYGLQCEPCSNYFANFILIYNRMTV